MMRSFSLISACTQRLFTEVGMLVGESDRHSFIGKIAGIDTYAHLSWFVILVLLTWSLASGWFAQLFPGWATTTYWLVPH